jgi:hypothetical protein
LEKKPSRFNRPVSIKLGTNHPWVKGILNIKIIIIKGPALFKGEIITKMQKFEEVFDQFSPRESLSQRSSYLHEIFLT